MGENFIKFLNLIVSNFSANIPEKICIFFILWKMKLFIRINVKLYCFIIIRLKYDSFEEEIFFSKF